MRRIAYLTIVFSLAGCQQEEIPAKNSEYQVALAKVKDDIAGAHLQIALNRASAERQERSDANIPLTVQAINDEADKEIAAVIARAKQEGMSEATIARILAEVDARLLAEQASAEAKKVKHGGLLEPKSEKAEPVNLCWQDYCPCESSETALDRTICRNAKGGIEMTDDQWSIGAMARDMKRDGDRLKREIDDINAGN